MRWAYRTPADLSENGYSKRWNYIVTLKTCQVRITSRVNVADPVSGFGTPPWLRRVSHSFGCVFAVGSWRAMGSCGCRGPLPACLPACLPASQVDIHTSQELRPRTMQEVQMVPFSALPNIPFAGLPLESRISETQHGAHGQCQQVHS